MAGDLSMNDKGTSWTASMLVQTDMMVIFCYLDGINLWLLGNKGQSIFLIKTDNEWLTLRYGQNNIGGSE